MEEPKHVKARTMIMVVSMIVLPLAAVVGVKLPAFLRSERSWNRETSTIAATSKPLAAGNGSRSTTIPRPIGTAPDAVKKLPKPEDKDKADSPNYPIIRVGNIDVRPEGSNMVLPASGATVENRSPATEVAGARDTNLKTASGDAFLEIQQRLRALGATHYSLETWGSTGQAYRFQCRMAAGHDPNYSRHFEATDVDPLRVMQTVLEEVESWKSGRLP